MDNDDLPVGRILSRREVLKLMGLFSAAALAGCAPSQTATSAPTVIAGSATATTVSAATAAATGASSVATATAAATAITAVAVPSCIVRPELTEGPYFVDEQINRSDVRSDPSDGSVREGARLNLKFNVAKITNSACEAFEGAIVDIWHCDAQGRYSDVNDQGFSTQGQKWLRGYQVTDANGMAQFTTIYPGWYPGRAVHIHFKVRTGLNDNGYEFTSQFFFDEALSDQVFAGAPYAGKGQRNTLNSNDNIYGQSGGQTLLNVTEDGGVYSAAFDIGLQM
jgi:protocatechuate 3,4-dioxygenase beta subunit